MTEPMSLETMTSLVEAFEPATSWAIAYELPTTLQRLIVTPQTAKEGKVLIFQLIKVSPDMVESVGVHPGDLVICAHGIKATFHDVKRTLLFVKKEQVLSYVTKSKFEQIMAKAKSNGEFSEVTSEAAPAS